LNELSLKFHQGFPDIFCHTKKLCGTKISPVIASNTDVPPAEHYHESCVKGLDVNLCLGTRRLEIFILYKRKSGTQQARVVVKQGMM